MLRVRALARPAARIAAALGLAGLAATAGSQPASAGNYVSISGSGSSWASVAIDQWAQDLRSNGLVANYNPIGSAAGRLGYINNQYDFVGSDPPFRNGQDELGGTSVEHSPYSYSYVPDTAGGTAFMYHITVGGHLITNLRLSPQVIMEIFTGAITNWDDPRITQIYGAQLPNLPITPVVRSDGSGATYFLSRWIAHLFPSQWNAFCQKVHPGIHLPCPQTEFYPPSGWGNVKAENGSNNVATYITSSYGDGAIGYDEYAYALNSHYPVVKVLNPGGYFSLPTASNVAVALTKAVIDENPSSPTFLQQTLDSVYTFTDPRSYPLSSYSYLIAPRAPTPPPFFTSPAGKGATLSTYIDFMLCAGQQQMAQLGYSPLPLNLVQGGLLQASQIPGHVPGPNQKTLAGCNNPTFTNGVLTLLKNAPQPSPCDKLGAPLNCVVKNGKAVAAGTGTGTGTGTKASSGAATGGATSSSSAAGAGSSTLGPGGTAATGPVSAQVVNLASDQASQTALGVLTALGIIAAVVIPPALGVWLRRRRQAHG
jgi:ABC-type phosphate transport system substrate-binding protein